MNCLKILSLIVLLVSLIIYILPDLLYIKSSTCQSYPIERNDDPYGRTTLLLKDGRYLEYSQIGPLDSKKIFFGYHGTPQTSISAFMMKEIAEENNIRIIITARPGFGLSSMKDSKTIVEIVNDIVELADHLNIQKFGVVGVSGGGPYAYAAAAVIPKERLIETIVICGISPLDFKNALQGMGISNAFMFSVTPRFQALIGFLTIPFVSENMIESDTVLDSMIPPDRAVFASASKEWKQLYLADTKMAFRCGIAGMYTETTLLSYYKNWGFTFKEINSPITIVHGLLDENVPVSHARNIYEVIPDGQKTLFVEENEGHLSILSSDVIKKIFNDDTNWK